MLLYGDHGMGGNPYPYEIDDFDSDGDGEKRREVG